MKKLQKGFTLIELVIVIIVIGFLAAVAAPKYVDLGTKAETAAGKASGGVVNTAIELQVAQNDGTFPTLTALAAAVKIDGVAATLATGNTGICVASGRRVPTFTDSAASVATSAGTDKVLAAKSVTGSKAAPDAACP